MAETETPTVETPENTEAPKDVTAAEVTPGAAGTAQNASSGSGSPAKTKPAVDIDALIETAAKAKSDADEKIREAETLRNKYGKYSDIDAQREALQNAQDDAARSTAARSLIRTLFNEGYNPSEIIQYLAEDVDLPPEQIDPAELPAKLPDIIGREVEKRVNSFAKQMEEKAAAERKAAEEKLAAEKKAADELRAKEDAETREEYLRECNKGLKAAADKFPICNAWIHRITPEKTLSVAAGFAKVNKRAPNAEELFPAIEAEFEQELAKVGRQSPAAAAPTKDEFEAEFEALDRQLLQRDPAIPPGTAPTSNFTSTGNEALDAIYKELERMDKDKTNRVNNTY